MELLKHQFFFLFPLNDPQSDNVPEHNVRLANSTQFLQHPHVTQLCLQPGEDSISLGRILISVSLLVNLSLKVGPILRQWHMSLLNYTLLYRSFQSYLRNFHLHLQILIYQKPVYIKEYHVSPPRRLHPAVFFKLPSFIPFLRFTTSSHLPAPAYMLDKIT